MSELRHTSGRRHGLVPFRLSVVRDLTPDEHDRLLEDLAEEQHRVDCELDREDRFGEAA